MKTCITCKKEKVEEEFPTRSDTKKLRNQCIKCYNTIISRAKEKKKLGLIYDKPILVNNGMKQCNKCNEWKELENFPKRSTEHGYRHECKDCKRIDLNKYYKETYNKIRRDKKKTDIQFRILSNHRTYIYKCLTKFKNKRGSSISYIGCDLQTLKEWIEFQFEDDMNWDNYGKIWSLDHVLPLSRFDLTDSKCQLIAFNWKNLRPLKDNFVKGNNIRLHDFFNNMISAFRFIKLKKLKSIEYQGIRESWYWLREKLRDGKKLLDDCISSMKYLKIQEMDNSQPKPKIEAKPKFKAKLKSKVLDEDIAEIMEKVQRL